ncbi:MAG: hypothetical protein IB617_02595 [Candidatus Nealsonbacteria bacterium]|nr:MAG: hypothetical protein IB617_02595 [Candidatus Nealsonbacteria bacterium]
MQTPWKIIFGYRREEGVNCQGVYEEIFRAALAYKFKNLPPGSVIPVDAQILTDSIFKLNAQDQLTVASKQIDGQKVKELFITTVFLRYLESKFPSGSLIFVVLPKKESSCDTAVMIVEPGVKIDKLDDKQLRLPAEHLPYLFQVKEYVDYENLVGDSLSPFRPIDVEKLQMIVKNYEEIVLVYQRDFLNYKSEDLDEFFKVNANCYFISPVFDLQYIPEGSSVKKYEPVPLDKDKHNYIVTSPDNKFAIAIFKHPGFLVEEKYIL